MIHFPRKLKKLKFFQKFLKVVIKAHLMQKVPKFPIKHANVAKIDQKVWVDRFKLCLCNFSENKVYVKIVLKSSKMMKVLN